MSWSQNLVEFWIGFYCKPIRLSIHGQTDYAVVFKCIVSFVNSYKKRFGESCTLPKINLFYFLHLFWFWTLDDSAFFARLSLIDFGKKPVMDNYCYQKKTGSVRRIIRIWLSKRTVWFNHRHIIYPSNQFYFDHNKIRLFNFSSENDSCNYHDNFQHETYWNYLA